MDPLMYDDDDSKAEVLPLTFVGGTADLKGQSLGGWQSAHVSFPLLPLAMTAVGDRVWVAQIRGGQSMARRLADLGIVQGCELIVASRTDSGSVIVALQGCRLGVGAGMAHQVMVSTHPPSTPSLSSKSAPESQTDTPVFAATSLGGAAVTESPETLTLEALAVGQSGCISGYVSGNRAYRSRLLSMGLTPGTSFTVTRCAPLGDPIEIDVRGFKLSLRQSEAAVLLVNPVV